MTVSSAAEFNQELRIKNQESTLPYFVHRPLLLLMMMMMMMMIMGPSIVLRNSL
jgi:hypothetical protein